VRRSGEQAEVSGTSAGRSNYRVRLNSIKRAHAAELERMRARFAPMEHKTVAAIARCLAGEPTAEQRAEALLLFNAYRDRTKRQ
jgi:hypothetical protein